MPKATGKSTPSKRRPASQTQNAQAIDGDVLQSILENAARATSPLDVFAEAIEKYGPSPELLYNQGIAYQNMGMHREAIDTLRRIDEPTICGAMAHNAQGVSFQALGQMENALAAFDKAISLNPQYFEALNNRGIIRQSLGHWKEAGADHVAAIMIAPGYAAAYNSLGVAISAINDDVNALTCFDKALELEPNNRDALSNRGISLHQLGRFDEAIESFTRAIELTPADVASTDRVALMAHFNRALAKLHEGDFAAGWRDYEYRSLTGTVDMNPICGEDTWRGEPFDGTIYVRVEQGFGDAIQFVRLLPMVRERCSRVVLEAPKELAELFVSCAGCDEVIVGPGEGRMWGTPESAKHVFLCSLGHIFQIDPMSTRFEVPYLTSPTSRRHNWRYHIDSLDPLHKSLRVGIVWAGSSSHPGDSRRSMTLDDFEALTRIPGVALFSLQKGPAAERLTSSPLAEHIHDLSPELSDFADTAAAIEALDIVITVDTAVAHLAGALGKPVRTLIDYRNDWRWLSDREDSPWYPSMRLLRKARPENPTVDLMGTWAPVIAKVATELESMADSRSRKSKYQAIAA